MAEAADMLKPTEAAVVAGLDLRDVNHAIDRKILPEGFFARGQARGVSAAGCILLTFYHDSARQLTSDERLSAIEEIGRRMGDRPVERRWSSLKVDWIVDHDFLKIDFKPFAKSTWKRWRQYRDAQDIVSSSPDTLNGTPVIRGTRVPVYDVAASVAAGHGIDRILEAYSGLTADQVELAALYAKANPLQGRPRATRLLEGATLRSEERVPRRPKAA